MPQVDLERPLQPQLLASDGPVCWIITALLKPVGDLERFQPAGFPEVGHVIYDAPRIDESGRLYKEKVCIVDSPASMANHLETVCLAGAGTTEMHPDLERLPRVVCVTDRDFATVDGKIEIDRKSPKDRAVVTTFTEGHRLASDYFLDARRLVDGNPESKPFRDVLRDEFKVIEVKRDKTYFIPPGTWWNIYKTVFRYDPNSLVHGLMFAKEQIKISRLLTAHLEAFGASRVGSSGVKFDRLQKTTSGQPIFSIDEEVATTIRATFVIDLAMLRSYGRGDNGLSHATKRLLLDLALWKITQLLCRPFRYRTQCYLGCESVSVISESGSIENPLATSSDVASHFSPVLPAIEMGSAIKACELADEPETRVYYPADQLFKAGKDEDAASEDGDADEDQGGE